MSLRKTDTGAFVEWRSLKSRAENTNTVPFLLFSLCLSALCPLFFPSRYIYCFFALSFLTEALPSHRPALSLSSSSGLNTADIFHISVHVLLQHLTRAPSVPTITFSDIRFSSLMNISSSHWADTPPAIAPWFSCRALRVRTQSDFPSVWCHVSLAGWAVRGKEKKEKTQFAKTELRNAKWLWCTPSGGRWRACLLISLTSLGRVKSAAETGSRAKRCSPPLASYNNLKIHLWPGYMEGQRASVYLIKLFLVSGWIMIPEGKINLLITLKSFHRLLSNSLKCHVFCRRMLATETLGEKVYKRCL